MRHMNETQSEVIRANMLKDSPHLPHGPTCVGTIPAAAASTRPQPEVIRAVVLECSPCLLHGLRGGVLARPVWGHDWCRKAVERAVKGQRKVQWKDSGRAVKGQRKRGEGAAKGQ